MDKTKEDQAIFIFYEAKSYVYFFFHLFLLVGG